MRRGPRGTTDLSDPRGASRRGACHEWERVDYVATRAGNDGLEAKREAVERRDVTWSNSAAVACANLTTRGHMRLSELVERDTKRIMGRSLLGSQVTDLIIGSYRAHLMRRGLHASAGSALVPIQ